MSEKLKMEIDSELAGALFRRHNGAKHTAEEIKSEYKAIKRFYRQYQKLKAKYDWLMDVYWEEQNIEGHFGEPIYYGALRRMKNLETKMRNLHRIMFRRLTSFDGNGGQTFDQFGVISVQDILEDFERKYIDKK